MNTISLISRISTFVLLWNCPFLFTDLSAQELKNIQFTDNKSSFAISFTENKGQISDQFYGPRPDVLFYGKTNGMVYHLRDKGISYQLYHFQNSERSVNTDIKSHKSAIPNLDQNEDSITIYRADINWIGSNNDYSIEVGEQLPGYNNFYSSTCPDGLTGLKSFKSITYINIYDDIDLKWYEKDGFLEYDFIIDPNGEYEQIQLEINGADSIYLNSEKHLVIQTPFGEIIQLSPIANQGNKTLNATWVLEGKRISFYIESYDRSKTLIIDPIVRLWGTYYGGSNTDNVNSSTRDAAGNIYIAGETRSTASIATSGSHQTSFGGSFTDAYLAKFNSNGSRQWATYYGGSNWDIAYACTADKLSNIYLAGFSESSSAIATNGSHQSSINGREDAFLVKFNSNGIRQWATYYGGSSTDIAFSCIADSSLNVYLSGYTLSNLAIATSGSHQSVKGNTGTNTDGFLVKFNSNGVRQWATYYGGKSEDYIEESSIDNSLNIYLAGYTNSNSAIATSGAYQTTFGGDQDAFLVKFNSNGLRLWGTYFGGSDEDHGWTCSTDSTNNIYLAGHTYSDSGIANINSHQPTRGGSADGFIVKFDSLGNRIWSTYYGGSDIDYIKYSIIDSKSNLIATGVTRSTSSISTTLSIQNSIGGSFDAFLLKFESNGTRQWGTYYGGSGSDDGRSCFVDEFSNIYMSGRTASDSSIATSGSYKGILSGNSDGFLVKIHDCFPSITNVNLSSCDSLLSPSASYTWYSSGFYSDTLPNSLGCDSVLSISLNIVSTPAIDSISNGSTCDSGSVTLFASSSTGLINWFSIPTGGTSLDTGNIFTSPVISTNQIFYTEATLGTCTSSPRALLNAQVFTTPSIISTTPAAICDSGIVTLSTLVSSGTVYWYASSGGGSSIDSGITFTTPLISSDTTFYINATDNGCTSSPRIPLTASVFSTPSILSTTSDTTCDSGTLQLSAIFSSGILNWYNSPSGGTNLGMGSSFTTPSINNTTMYFVDATDTICISPRTAVDAVVYHSSTASLTETACFSYTSPSGRHTYSNTGNYKDTLVNNENCDSIITIFLTINKVNTSVTVNDNELTASANNATYQWMDCNTNTIILSATDKSFTPSYNGNFAAIITQNNCTDTSECVTILTIDIRENTLYNSVSIFPNPNDGIINIEFGKLDEVSITVFDARGKLIYQEENINTETYQFELNARPGLYIIELRSQGERQHYKLVRK